METKCQYVFNFYMFTYLLKAGREEPVVSKAEAITAETNPDAASDRYTPQIKVGNYRSPLLLLALNLLIVTHDRTRHSNLQELDL